MATSQIARIRQQRGWTQEKLTELSGIGVRTVQRLEAGSEASLETLASVASALDVPVRDLYEQLDDSGLADRVDSLDRREREQQAGRDAARRAWWHLWAVLGILVTVFCVVNPFDWPVLWIGAVYWIGGAMLLPPLLTIVVEPRLDRRFPLSHSPAEKRARDTWGDTGRTTGSASAHRARAQERRERERERGGSDTASPS
jgi:transcriptional regulator with XRE-family HTH domain